MLITQTPTPFISVVDPEVQKYVIKESGFSSDSPNGHVAYIRKNYVLPALENLLEHWGRKGEFMIPCIRNFKEEDWKLVANDIENFNALFTAMRGGMFNKRLEFVTECLHKSFKMRKAFGNQFLTFRVVDTTQGYSCWVHFKQKHMAKQLNDLLSSFS